MTFDNTGKSTLSKVWLAQDLSGSVLKLDDYFLENGKPYRERLNYDDISNDLASLQEQGRPVIVEGICLLDVVDKIGVKLDALVYVKKLNDMGLWHDKDICDPQHINLDSPRLNRPGAEAVLREVASYHLDRDPLGKADFLFVRVVPS